MYLARITCDGPCPADLAGQLEQWTMWLVVGTVAVAVCLQAWTISQRQECETEE